MYERKRLGEDPCAEVFLYVQNEMVIFEKSHEGRSPFHLGQEGGLPGGAFMG